MEGLISRIQSLKEQALAESAPLLSAVSQPTFSVAEGMATLDELENRFLSKKGLLSEAMRSLRDVAPGDRPKIGALVNEVKAALEERFLLLRQQLEQRRLAAQLEAERIDITLPGRRHTAGALHPVTKVIEQVSRIFENLGFQIADGPEVETEFHNFEALNIPADHPAREMQDTFYLPGGKLLRSQTSPVQIRVMQGQKPPIRILAPGAVFRSDYDMTHVPMFHQIEGLCVDEGVRFSDLRGVLEAFARQMFGDGSKIRLRPSYFPFVEPGAEVDVSCFACKGKPKGCRVCKQTGWIEILGAGMVHREVFRQVDPTQSIYGPSWTGFAFGMGVERIAMLKFGITDLRLMFEGDVRFLRQFGV